MADQEPLEQPKEPVEKQAWIVRKDEVPSLVKRGREHYPEHARASRAYSQFISGYTVEEIAEYLTVSASEVVTVEDIRRDVQHIQGNLSTKTIIAHNNDRNRILIQRQQGDSYQVMLKDSLAITPREYLKAGVSPTGVMKEYREAVGMVEKPGAFSLHLSQTNAQIQVSNSGGVTSSEDVLRRAMAKLEEPKALNIEAQTIEQEMIPDVDGDQEASDTDS